MRAARCDRYGSPDVVTVWDVPDPTPGAGEVLVEIRAAAVNFPDVLTVADKYQVSVPTPFTPGSEFAGVVRSAGVDVRSVEPGDAVMGSAMTGAFAELICVPEGALTPKPDGLDWISAAAFRVTYTTAYHALVTFGGMRAGDWVVVLGAAGGVGTAAVDVARRLGARVIACASSEERLAAVATLGAEVGVSYDLQDLKARIKEITGGGAQVVIDPVGGRYAEPALRALAPGGTFVTVGYATGEIPRIPLNLVLLKDLTIRGVELRTLAQRHPDAPARAQQALAALVSDGMRPLVSQVFGLDDVAGALTSLNDRAAVGKVVIALGGAC
ncbi:NADPH:quinone oxidoreductase family protein [Rhodococcus artemisiae]|uniref:NADPH:quinone oxidoreductase family protein n=1 Tax=Rhodococcus artemisiae TaxID=714159 RepID=A0ABU7L6K6_9NOCA|nr:NADPH:quinone oxidoreductase family protein [Rhodococcus artemisiae]MEE2057180.1 NADPH:quinone oxidoreductase family protein [Rhodococcus artemisiae]